ncbi:MAG: helix-turn-helix transcriptional regulator [Pseudohongiellaceae bacterium]
MMQIIIDGFVLLGISQLLTTSIYFAIHHRTRSGLLFIALFFCLACYVGFRYSALSDDISRVIYQLSLITPILLYAISRYLFKDDSHMQSSDWILILFFVISRMIIGGVYLGNATEFTPAMLLIAVYILPLGILIYFSVMAAFYTTQGYKSDLLVNRRTLRVYFVFSTLVFVVPRLLSGLIVYTLLLLDKERLSLSALPGVVEAVYLALLFFAFNQLIVLRHDGLTRLFREPKGLNQSAVKADSNAENTAAAPATDGALINNILKLMEVDKLYTKQGVTIAMLAIELGVHEQKLRQTINTEMGYRNFNQFLNHYRLEEASKLLKNSVVPISNVAFDVGYASLSSFNSVFKNHFGATPSEYRVKPNSEPT